MRSKTRALVLAGTAGLAAAILGVAGVALAAPRHHSVTMVAHINGQRFPVQGFERTIRLPGGGVFREESFTWGSGLHAQAATAPMRQMMPQEAQAAMVRSMAMFRALTISLNQQMAAMQSLLRVSFGPVAQMPATSFLPTGQPVIVVPFPSMPQRAPLPAATTPKVLPFSAAAPRYRDIRWMHGSHPAVRHLT